MKTLKKYWIWLIAAIVLFGFLFAAKSAWSQDVYYYRLQFENVFSKCVDKILYS